MGYRKPFAAVLACVTLAACGAAASRGPSMLAAAGVPMAALPPQTPLVSAQVPGSPIAHVIVVIQENRTFNNLFASSILTGGRGYPGAETTQAATIGGKKIALRSTPFEFPADPDHAHAALVAEWNHGKMDGFPKDPVYANTGYPSPPPNFPMAYVPDYETIVYHTLAQRYALADHNFAPRLTPTFPGHVFLVAARSQPADDPTDPTNWGCDSKPGTTVGIFTGPGEGEKLPGVFPCFDYLTIADLLDRKHVSWKYYTGAIGNVTDAAVNVYDAMKRIRYGPDWTANVSTPMSNVLADIQNCKLPQVSYVTPTWLNSDHAGDLSNGGPGWVGSIYLAIEQSQLSSRKACRYYGDTAMILTWDDSGGWYDEVAPPSQPNGAVNGFRIPIVVASAWARSSYKTGSKLPYVSHKQRETTAIIRFIEKNWALGNMGARDASGDDLSDMFDYRRVQPIPPISELAVRAMIRKTDWNLARSRHDTHVVDDDK
jgi:phospholipase C